MACPEKMVKTIATIVSVKSNRPIRLGIVRRRKCCGNQGFLKITKMLIQMVVWIIHSILSVLFRKYKGK
jgi:hypothetical protein